MTEHFTPDRLAGVLGCLGANRAPDLFAALAELYRDPGRHYHSDAHVAECLRALDAHRDLAERPEEVELAIWFHDAVYDTRRADNEEASARLAAECLTPLGIEAATVERIAELIRWTKDHRAECPDAELLLDIDLGILGQAPEVFERYDAAIRAEYAWVPEDPYRAGRAQVLQSFLDRERIYRTPTFRAAFERPARANLKAKLAELRQER